MDDGMKNWILILGIFCVILLIGNISSCGAAYKNKAARDKEMFTRLDCEEKIGKVAKQISDLEDKLKAKTSALQEAKAAEDDLKKDIDKEKLANETLKNELQKITELKNTLESDLKEALAGKAVKKK